jgi:hypothetical protein
MRLTRVTRFRGTAVVAVALALVLAACSSSSKNPPPNPVPAGATIDQACADTAAAFCTKQDGCSPTARKVAFADIDTCTTRLKALCVTNATASGANVSVQQITACAHAYSAQSCQDALALKNPEQCNYPGQLADGVACATDAQCTGARCRKAKGDTCGKCGSRGDSGADCVADEDCKGSLACLGSKCAMAGVEGTACDDAHPCGVTLACVDGTCGELLGKGATCHVADANCDVLGAGVMCGAMSSTCDAVVFVESGTCGFTSPGAPFAFCQAGRCSLDAMGNGKGTCTPNAPDGMPCSSTTTGANCTAPAVCHQGICTVPDPKLCN